MIDPQRLAQDARVNSALEVFTAAILNIENPQPRGVRKMTPMNATNNLIAAICAAHLDALAGEPVGETTQKAVAAVKWYLTPEPDMQAQQTAEGCVNVAAPILRAPLLAKLVAAEARVKELEMLLSTETARANEGWRYSDVRRQALNDLVCAAHSYKENRENRNGVPLGAYMPGSPTRVLAEALTAARSAVEAP